ncbi:MAG: ATP-binding protein [Fuerstiella sp.]
MPQFSPAATCFSVEFPAGGSSYHSFDGQNWTTINFQHPANFVSSGKEKHVYFSVGNKLYHYSGEHETPLRDLQPPLSGDVSMISHQANGDISFVQGDQVLRYRPRKTKPRPAVRIGATKIVSGDDTPTLVSFSALNRFEPDSNSESFNYSWRIDDGVWSSFTDTPGAAFSLGDLSIGRHVLHLKAINAAGMVSDSVAEAAFSIHPIPIQERPWFVPVVVLTMVTVCGLTLAATIARSKLQQYADGLEHLVRDRTAELRDRQRRETELAENKLDQLRRKLVRQTRLATIGQMTASIAHEIRNPLGAVRNAAYFIKRYIHVDNPKLPQHLEIIDQEVEVVDHVIRDMLEMARSTEPIKESFDLSEVVQKIFNQNGKNNSVYHQLHASSDPFMIHADQGQIRQVLQNLIVNANQALNDGGEISVELDQNGNDAIIAVRDTGPGVSDEHRDQLFEPLFTTKAKGTGLGLTICRQLIERHGGSIELQANAGAGASFLIRLPQHSSTEHALSEANSKHEFQK